MKYRALAGFAPSSLGEGAARRSIRLAVGCSDCPSQSGRAGMGEAQFNNLIEEAAHWARVHG
jgi:hypothetical protein